MPAESWQTRTAASHVETLALLLERSPTRPSLPGIVAEDVLQPLFRARAQRYLEHPSQVHWQGDEAAAGWRRLDFDSRLFGFPAAALDFAVAQASGHDQAGIRNVIQQILAACELDGIRHVTARASASDLPLIHSLEHFGFQLLDGIQMFGLRLVEDQPPGVESMFQTGMFEPWQLDQVLDLAATAYRFDRFHADPALPPGCADEFHRQWLRNSCHGTAADGVFVASQGREVLGFATVKLDAEIEAACGVRLASIVLVATKKTARGRGVGKTTTHAALNWLKSRGCDAATVGTQLCNISAGRLYESCGFRLVNASLTLRKLL